MAVHDVCVTAYDLMYERLTPERKEECTDFVIKLARNRDVSPPRNLYPLGCSWLRVTPDVPSSVYAYAFFVYAVKRINVAALSDCRAEPIPNTPYVFGYPPDDEIRPFEVVAINSSYLTAMVDKAGQPASETWVAWSTSDPTYKTSEFGEVEDIDAVVLGHTSSENPAHIFLDVICARPNSRRPTSHLISALTREAMPAHGKTDIFHDSFTAIVPRFVADVTYPETRPTAPTPVPRSAPPTPRGLRPSPSPRSPRKARPMSTTPEDEDDREIRPKLYKMNFL